MEIACRDCGRIRRQVTLATFVCRFCLSLHGVRVPRKWRLVKKEL